MSSIASKPFALDDFLALPEVRPALEYHGGRLIQKMSPRWKHGIIQPDLTACLNAFARPRRLGRAVTELRCTFGGESHVFDIAYFARDRIPTPEEQEAVGGIPSPPDLAIEILSPGQTVGELSRKLRSAVRRGVRLGWLIDDRKRAVRVLRPGGKPVVLRVGDVLDGGDVLPGFTLPVADLFGWLDDN